MVAHLCHRAIFGTKHVFLQFPAIVNEVGVEAFTSCFMIIYIFVINKQLKRKFIDFGIFHDANYTTSCLFYDIIIEKIKVIFLFNDPYDLAKFIF